MDQYKVYRENIFDILQLWSSKEEQLDYQKNVPTADVPAELFCEWESSYADGYEFEKYLSVEEIILINEFNILLNHIGNKTPNILPEISEFILWEEWTILNKKAIEILEKIQL